MDHRDGCGGTDGDGGPATEARFRYLQGVAVDGSGDLYIADTNNHRVRRVDAATGVISTIAGTGEDGFWPGVRCRAVVRSWDAKWDTPDPGYSGPGSRCEPDGWCNLTAWGEE